MAVTTARQKVFAYLSKNRVASAREISRGLKMSAPTVRHHLRVLASDGRLEVGPAQERTGRGRPRKMYSIPKAALGDNLSALSEAIWAEAGKTVQVEALAKRLAGTPEFSNQPAAKRLSLIVERLNQMNYHARWEAGAGGPRVIFGHCPYMAILPLRPELCRVDRVLLKELTGQAAEPFSNIGEGSPICVFALTV